MLFLLSDSVLYSVGFVLQHAVSLALLLSLYEDVNTSHMVILAALHGKLLHVKKKKNIWYKITHFQMTFSKSL